MNLPHDLKDFHAREDDPFVLFTEGECIVILACALALGFILGSWQ